jgi:serine protease Do
MPTMSGTSIINRRLKNSFLAGAAFAAAAVSLGVAVIGGANAQAPRLVTPPPAVALGDGAFSFADLVERVAPAVVSVLVEREVERPQIPDELQQFFQFRFGQPPEEFEGEPELAEAQGSGFFIDAAGHIVTNNHVVEGAKEIRVSLSNGKELKATLVGADPLTDLAVLKVEDMPKGQAFVQFAEDVNLRVGDWVVAVGNPFGLGGSVTSGIVSAIGGESRQGTFLDFIQIDAPINRGNSGGPTFDLNGRVVGVNTAIYSPNGGSVGIGFAIPAASAKATVASLIKNGSVTRGWLGVSIQPVDDDIKAALKLKEAKGALVAEVIAGTPAAKAGLIDGDLIQKLNGRDLADPRDLTRSISALAPGEKARLTVLRNGAEKIVTVTLGQRDAEERIAEAPQSQQGEDILSGDAGVRVTELTDAARQQFRVPETVQGVLVTSVKPGSPGADAGLQPGVVILQVDGEPVATAASLKKKLADAKAGGKDAVLLRLQLGEVKQFRALTIGKK